MFLTMVSMIMFLTIVSMIKFVTMVTMRIAVLCLCHESVLWMGNCFSECRRNAPRHQLMTRGLATWSYHDHRWQDEEELILPSFTSNQSTHGVQEMQIPIFLSSIVLLFSINLFWIKGRNIEYSQMCQNLWSLSILFIHLLAETSEMTQLVSK